ncbi:hypothetical protein [Serratia liquefaciens]|uniref:hypothetical protein n=1 Tax=Serratia liquefaciens TaxID=614 RepID=UPI001E29B429|nr:hypothetical protein [Serratia liquefaciens]
MNCELFRYCHRIYLGSPVTYLGWRDLNPPSEITTVQAKDKTTVLGMLTLLAGAVKHIAEGDYSVATKGNLVASVGGYATTAVAGSLTEKIGNIRSSIAALHQNVIASVVWIGSQQINVMALMLETLEV